MSCSAFRQDRASKSSCHFIALLAESVPALGKGFATVSRYIQGLRGGSQPFLAEASDGLVYIVKLRNSLHVSSLLFNEGIGNELYRACGLPIPTWKSLLVGDSFLDHNPQCWFQMPEGRLRPDSGLCFASRYLGGDGIRISEILPGTSFSRVRNRLSFWMAWMIDILALHADNRQAIFREGPGGQLYAFFIDHGHLLGGPKGELDPYFLTSSYLDKRIYEGVTSTHLLMLQNALRALDVDRLWQRAQTLPNGWRTKSQLDNFAQCLDRMSNACLVQDVANLMEHAFRRSDGCVRVKHAIRRNPSASVLCSGIQTSSVGERPVAPPNGNLGCPLE
jgi:hypothetical protein